MGWDLETLMSNLDAIVEIWCVFSTDSFSGVRFAVCFRMQYRDSARDWSPLGMTALPSSSSSKRSSTKRSISLVSTAGVEQATKYQKIRNVPTIGTANSPGSTRTSNRRGRRSPRPRASCRVATAFAVLEPEAFDSSLDDLVDALKMLHITTPFERLPNEVLLKIFEELAPTPVAPRGNTSLGSIRRVVQLEHSPPVAQGTTSHWAEYLNGRNNIKTLCLVNKRTRLLATPLLYRSILIWQAQHLWALGRAFAIDPSLPSHVRHFNCAVDLEQADTTVTPHAWESWQFPNHWMGKDTGASHPYHRFSRWFVQCEAANNSSLAPNYRAGQAFFCAILCLTNRVETLNVQLPVMLDTRLGPRAAGTVPSLWRWFLDDTNPFAEFSKVIPMTVTAGSPTEAQLLGRPCWPPPFLRNITVEISPDGLSGSYVHLDVIPPIDALQHAALLKLNGLAPFDPVDVLRPSRLRKLSPAEMLCVTGYLDGLQQIPYIADSSDAMTTHLDRLKAFDAYLSSPDYDHTSARGLAQILRLLPAPGTWNSRLLTRSKSLSLPLWALFVLDFGQLEPPSSISTLTFRYDVVDSRPLPGLEILLTRHRLQTHLLDPTACPACIPTLEELHLPLRIPIFLTNLAYFGRGGRLRLSSAETGSYLPDLKVLELTTEALFGALVNMHGVFGGRRFITVGHPPADGEMPITHVAPSTTTTSSSVAPSTAATDPLTRGLEALVDELPPALKELKLLEWWWPFSEPVMMPARFTQRRPPSAVAPVGEKEERWPKRYKHVQRAFVAGLEELAGVLGEKRPSVDKVTVVVHSWTSGQYYAGAAVAEEDKREAGRVWMSWAKEKKVGLKALKKVFRDKGIAFKVALARGDSDVS
ncbi:hypothetical protein B0T18DRAFT_174097 [Schizothecium vesticola]|uniref:F-box domain-containing protein n=1 Tax=Schizothecium vesticola TaxID=314040 RepID=A0AA40EPB1_9PEZI|nr:hypothetical protein B0T18DRAFT_174097 [Schizothecium vesticola]